MSRPISARIDTDALRHNLSIARAHAPHSKAWCVVKANAYGHGLDTAVDALRGVADGFALLELDQAVRLREAGHTHPLLLLEGFFDETELPLFAEYELTPVVHRLDQVDLLARVALPTRLPVYLKTNTGMNRLGLTADELPRALARLRDSHAVSQLTLMTHFADADGEGGIDTQLQRFAAMREAAGGGLPVTLANSAAILRYPAAHGDWVRPGIMLYGGSPYPARQRAADIGLKPVMTLESQVIGVQQLAAGDTVGYGCTFTAPGPMRIGVVACGYADGYPRHAPTGTPINVAGRMTRIVGRVSMDMLAVDLTELPEAGIGAPVVLWGEGCPADDVAMAAGTISYELFCALAARVPVTVR